MKKYFLLFFIMFLFVILFANDNIYKNWIGKGKIIVSWCEQEYLHFNITINKDNIVEGTIGDAEIINAKVSKRNFIMRLFGNGKYIIKGDLKGDIVKKEQIQRKSFQFMFSMKNGKIDGGMHTSGSKVGGKEKMKLTVTDIILE